MKRIIDKIVMAIVSVAFFILMLIKRVYEWFRYYTLEIVLIGSIVILIFVWGYLVIQDKRDWDKFKVAHNCKVTDHIRGSSGVSTGIVLLPNGQVSSVTTPTSTPDKTGYICDDGIKYWR